MKTRVSRIAWASASDRRGAEHHNIRPSPRAVQERTQSSKQLAWCAGLLVVAMAGTGCRSFPTMSPEFAVRPENYRHIAVTPIAVSASGQLDKTLSAADVETQRHTVTSNLFVTLTDVLKKRGYEPGPMTELSCEQPETPTQPKTRELLEEARREIHGPLFDYAFPGLRARTTNEFRARMQTNALCSGTQGGDFYKSKQPFHFCMNSPLAALQSDLGCTNADALLLMDSTLFFESPAHANQRAAWNYSGGTLVFLLECVAAAGGASSLPDPFLHTPSTVHHTITLVDPRTREVLWFDERHVPRTDARKDRGLRSSLNTALTYFPATKDKKR